MHMDTLPSVVPSARCIQGRDLLAGHDCHGPQRMWSIAVYSGLSHWKGALCTQTHGTEHLDGVMALSKDSFHLGIIHIVHSGDSMRTEHVAGFTTKVCSLVNACTHHW